MSLRSAPRYGPWSRRFASRSHDAQGNRVDSALNRRRKGSYVENNQVRPGPFHPARQRPRAPRHRGRGPLRGRPARRDMLVGFSLWRSRPTLASTTLNATAASNNRAHVMSYALVKGARVVVAASTPSSCVRVPPRMTGRRGSTSVAVLARQSRSSLARAWSTSWPTRHASPARTLGGSRMTSDRRSSEETQERGFRCFARRTIDFPEINAGQFERTACRFRRRRSTPC
jgi:hypothetical protein